MKKRYMLLALILAATPALAARQTISPVAPSSSPADLRGKLNVELGKADDNDVELYTDVAAKSNYADVLQRWHSYPAGYTFAIDDLTMYGGKIYKAVTSHVKGGSNPLVDTTNWQEFFVAGQGSNLEATAGASTVVVTNDNGTGFTLPAATGSTAGAMTAADATKLSMVAAGATANASDAYLLALGNHTGTLASTAINDFSSAVNTVMSSYISKTAGIENGAQRNVKPDWNATPGAANEILNQPTVLAADADTVVTGELDLRNVILPYWNTLFFNELADEDDCTGSATFIYLYDGAFKQCLAGTPAAIGSGTGSMTYPGAGIANSTGSAWGTSYTVDSDLGDSTNLSTAFPTAAAVKTLVNGLSASAIPSYSATPADVADGVVWYNTTANELCVAESAGVSCVAMTYTADDTTPSNSKPWFPDEVDQQLGGTAISTPAITVAGLGLRGAPISVTGSSGAGYRKNGGSCTSTPGRVYSNPVADTVEACVTRSSSNSTETTATVTIGTDSDTYSVTTEAPSITYIVNDQFDSGDCTGWSVTGGGTCSTSTGDALLTNGAYTTIQKNNILSTSTTYNYSVTMTAETMTTSNFVIWNGTDNTVIFAHSASPGTFTGTFTTSGAMDDMIFQIANGTAGQTVTISDIKIWQ
jgi:hypothetical protein